MFLNSSQSKYWSFADEKEIFDKRKEINEKYIETYDANGNVLPDDFFLTPQEEHNLVMFYKIKLSEFCARFDPTMPKNVAATSFQYFKRFFIKNSVMDFHPRDILHTCIYLACKVEEFNISIQQFVFNIKDDPAKMTDLILSTELLLMQHLNYYLTVHSPFRPINGFILDLHTRANMSNISRVLSPAHSFIDTALLTDAVLIYSPAQIGLAAVLHGASLEKCYLDQYVTETLLLNTREHLPNLVETVRKIRLMVKRYAPPNYDEVRMIEKKLERCRNQSNNPDSPIYKERMRQMVLEDDGELAISMPYEMPGITDTSMLNVSQ